MLVTVSGIIRVLTVEALAKACLTYKNPKTAQISFMKKFRYYFALLALLTIITGALFSSAAFAGALSNSTHNTQPVMLYSLYGKTANGEGYNAKLFATYENKGVYATDIKIEITFKDKSGYTIVPGQNSGYSPAITLADFYGDGGKQVFYGAGSGGSGAFGYYYVFNITKDGAEAVFDFEQCYNTYSAKYTDGYKVQVSESLSGAEYFIDISRRGQDYLSSIYDECGLLLKPVSADVSAVNTVLPFFDNYRGRFNLIIMRRITGLYGADALGYTQDFVTFTGEGFTPYFSCVCIYPEITA